MMHQDEEHYEVRHADRRKTENDAMHLHIHELQLAIKSLDEKMSYHHQVFRAEVENSVERVFERSFPDGDPEGHRKHHELVIQREEAKVKFWTELFTNTAKWAGIGLLAFMVHAVWAAFLRGPK